MASSTPHATTTPTWEERQNYAIASRERSARNKPDWVHLAKTVMPELYCTAAKFNNNLYDLERQGEPPITTAEKWTFVETQLREVLPEAMAALDTYAEHVEIWTVLDPEVINKLLEEATTEQEYLDIVYGTHVRRLVEEARASLTEPREEDYDSDVSINFIVEEDIGRSKASLARARKKANKRARAAAAEKNEVEGGDEDAAEQQSA